MSYIMTSETHSHMNLFKCLKKLVSCRSLINFSKSLFPKAVSKLNFHYSRNKSEDPQDMNID